MSDQNYANQYSAIIAKSWIDPVFRTRLIDYPDQVLAEYGIRFPAGVNVKINANADSGDVTLGLPARPAGISDDDISKYFLTPGCF